jgi:hypothetical protein
MCANWTIWCFMKPITSRARTFNTAVLSESKNERARLRHPSRKEHRGVDLISNALPFGLWHAEPNAISNVVEYAKGCLCFRSSEMAFPIPCGTVRHVILCKGTDWTVTAGQPGFNDAQCECRRYMLKPPTSIIAELDTSSPIPRR